MIFIRIAIVIFAKFVVIIEIIAIEMCVTLIWPLERAKVKSTYDNQKLGWDFIYTDYSRVRPIRHH